MPTVLLTPHPSSPIDRPGQFIVSVQRAGSLLHLHYRVDCDPACVLLPPTAVPQRRDGLWRETCFELFVGQGDSPAYLEFNFSPAGHWAAYAFDAPRAGMREAQVETPQVECHSQASGVESTVHVQLPEAGFEGEWRCALGAVLCDRAGQPSYWALHYAPGPPDFHDPAARLLWLEAEQVRLEPQHGGSKA